MSYFIGLMSGTSLDGMDAALVEVQGKRLQYLAHHHLPMPEALRQQFLALNESGADELHRAAEAAWQHAELAAATVEALLQQEALSASSIQALGLHGQTVRHCPQHSIPYTWQLHQAARVAELTGITTVCDFRSRDIAAGGQGAPLAPLFQRALLQDLPIQMLNIGGVANISILSATESQGFDVGAGNALLDAWIDLQLQKRFDAGGQWARTGKILPHLLQNLCADAYFQLPPPKSTGRDYFSLNWLQTHLRGDEAPADVQRTLLEWVAWALAEALQQRLDIPRVMLVGGGAQNDFLRERLTHFAPQFDFQKPPLPVEVWEAAGFAWLAAQCLAGEALPLSSVTGGQTRILGAIYPA